VLPSEPVQKASQGTDLAIEWPFSVTVDFRIVKWCTQEESELWSNFVYGSSGGDPVGSDSIDKSDVPDDVCEALVRVRRRYRGTRLD
jgi:hypothetical protein